MAEILPPGRQQFFNANGAPLVGGKVYFYIPGTTTQKDTWQDAGQTILNTNPVVLDAVGSGAIWGSGAYRQIVKDFLGNTIWDEVVQSPGLSVTPSASSGTGGALTLDYGSAQAFEYTFGAGGPYTLDPLTLTGLPDEGAFWRMLLKVSQNATGGNSIVWPTSWFAAGGGQKPLLSQGANAIDVFGLWGFGSDFITVGVIGQNFVSGL